MLFLVKLYFNIVNYDKSDNNIVSVTSAHQ